MDQEAAEAEALLQRQWAARIGLPQLRITQRVGTRSQRHFQQSCAISTATYFCYRTCQKCHGKQHSLELEEEGVCCSRGQWTRLRGVGCGSGAGGVPE